DSPLVSYVLPSENHDSRFNALPAQVILHAPIANERSALDTLSQTAPTDGRGRVRAHYLISREGVITQLVREYESAWHAGNSNAYSIGIELVDDGRSTIDDNWITSAQLSQAALLVREITKGYGIRQNHLTWLTPICFEKQVALTPGNPAGIAPTESGIIGHY